MSCQSVRDSTALEQTRCALAAFQQKGSIHNGRYLVVVGSKRQKHLEFRKLGFIEWLFRQFGFGPSRPRKVIKELVRSQLYDEKDAGLVNQRNAGFFGFGRLSIEKIRAIATTKISGSNKEKRVKEKKEKNDAVQAILTASGGRYRFELSQWIDRKGVDWVLDALELYQPVSEKEMEIFVELYTGMMTTKSIRTRFDYMERIVTGLESLKPLPYMLRATYLTCGVYDLKDKRYLDLAKRVIQLLPQASSDVNDTRNRDILGFFHDVINESNGGSGFEATMFVIDLLMGFPVPSNDVVVLNDKYVAFASNCRTYAKCQLSDDEIARYNSDGIELPVSFKDNFFAKGKKLLAKFKDFLTSPPGDVYLRREFKFNISTKKSIEEIAGLIVRESRVGVALDFLEFLLTLKACNIGHVTNFVDSMVSKIHDEHSNPTVRNAFAQSQN